MGVRTASQMKASFNSISLWFDQFAGYAMGLAAEKRDPLAVLVADFNVVDAAAAGERALLADGGQHIADTRRRQVLDAAAGGDGIVVVAVAGIGKGGVGQSEDE